MPSQSQGTMSPNACRMMGAPSFCSLTTCLPRKGTAQISSATTSIVKTFLKRHLLHRLSNAGCMLIVEAHKLLYKIYESASGTVACKKLRHNEIAPPFDIAASFQWQEGRARSSQ